MGNRLGRFFYRYFERCGLRKRSPPRAHSKKQASNAARNICEVLEWGAAAPLFNCESPMNARVSRICSALRGELRIRTRDRLIESQRFDVAAEFA